MPISVNTSKQQVQAVVTDDKVTATVSSGFGPTGPQGGSGVVAVTAPITNSGTSTSANIGLSVGTGLQVSSGSLAVTYGASSTSACAGSDARLSDSREWSAATVSQADAEAGTSTSRFAFTPLRVFQAIAAWWNASAAKTKLDGIAAGATANATDAQLRDRSTHTGTQAISTVTGLQTALDGKQASGTYATLVGGKVPAEQLPSYVDDIIEAANVAALPGSGSAGVLYVTLDTNKVYRWSGSTYVEVSAGASAWNDITGKPTFAAVATSGAYADLSGTPSPFVLPTATGSVLGGVKIGSGVTITDGVISVSTDYAPASDFDQGVKTTDSPTFVGIAIGSQTADFVAFGSGSGEFQIAGFGRHIGIETGYIGGDWYFSTGASWDFSDCTVTGLSYNSLEGLPALFDGAYSSLTGTPSTFAPTAHKSQHATGGSDALTASDIGAAAASHNHAWSDITSGVPSTFTPSAHAATHAPGGADELFDQSLNTNDSPKFESISLDGQGDADWVLDAIGGPFTIRIGVDTVFSVDDTGFIEAASIDASAVIGLSAVATSGSYDDLSNKPSLFDGAYTSLTSVPSTFTPSAHNHAASEITSGTLDAARLPLATTGSAGAIIVGSGLSVASGTLSVTTYAVRSDTVSSTAYTGRAVSGSATSASVWRIRKTVYTSAGAVSATTTATNVKWDDRLTASYS